MVLLRNKKDMVRSRFPFFMVYTMRRNRREEKTQIRVMVRYIRSMSALLLLFKPVARRLEMEVKCHFRVVWSYDSI